jgi:phage gp36-like protein
LGKRYTKEEITLIQELTQQGQTDETIAQQLCRSTNAIRNNIKTRETQTIQQLQEKRHKITIETRKLEYNRTQMQDRRNRIQQTLQMHETQFNKKLEIELINLKDRKTELFAIKPQEQMIKLTARAH